MTARRLGLIVLGVVLGAGAVFVVLVVKPFVDSKTIKLLEPAPFTANLPFAEPPVISSSGGRLKATLVAKNGTVRVSGVKVANTQTYGGRSAAGETKRGLIGPTLRVRPGERIDLTLVNELVAPKNLEPKAREAPDCSHEHEGEGQAAAATPNGEQFTNLHFHGLHVTPRTRRERGVKVYGDNVLLSLPAGRSHFSFRIPEDHQQGTFWYHAHRHFCTDDQVYRGLAGLLLIGDSRRLLEPPLRKIRTRSLALKDIQVTEQFDRFAIPGKHDWGDPSHYTVNGFVKPKMTVRPGETELWRLLNASAGVWYRVALVDEQRDGVHQAFQIVATDGNQRAEPVLESEVLIPPGQRVDLLVRAPPSGRLDLKMLEFNQGRRIFPEEVLATIDVRGARAPGLQPASEQNRIRAFPTQRGPERKFVFSIPPIPRNGEFDFLINNRKFDPARVDAAPTLGTIERWTLVNFSPEWHPFHIHQNDFRVISVNGLPPPPVDQGQRDVVGLPPLQGGRNGRPGTVVVDIGFTDFTGKFVFHCHILDHEDGGMMALVDVRRPDA